MLALIIASIIGYSFVGGISYSAIQNYSRPRCRYRDHDMCDGACNHSFVAGLSVLFWPVIIPPLLGGMFMSNNGKASRTERRHTKELAEAQHKLELARLKAEEAEMLDRQLGVR